MALVNVGEILADAGYHVIVCDFDLEAPGLERYLASDPKVAVGYRRYPGVIDLLEEYKTILAIPEAPPEPAEASGLAGDRTFTSVNGILLRRPSSYAVPIEHSGAPRRGSLRFLPAGRRDGDDEQRYIYRVQRFDWTDFYDKWAGGAYLDFFRRDLIEGGTVVLVDSRTGNTEHGGVCTHHLADVVVLLSAANDSNIEGIKWMADLLTDDKIETLRDGRRLDVLPVAARIEIIAETTSLGTFRKRFDETFADFVPEQVGDPKLVIVDAEIPYVPHFAFTEEVVAREGTVEHRELLKAYSALARAITLVGVRTGRLSPPKKDGWLDGEDVKDGERSRQTLERHGQWLASNRQKGQRAELRREDLTRVDYASVDLREADFTEAQLDQANLRGANLSQALLDRASLVGANLSGARMAGTSLRGANLQSAVLENADLDFADLSGASLQGATLDRASLRGAKLGMALLDRASMLQTDLGGADLADSSLRGADCVSASFVGANLQDADFKDAALDDADFRDANLAGAKGIDVRVLRSRARVDGRSTDGPTTTRRRPTRRLSLRAITAFKRIPRLRWRPIDEQILDRDAQRRFPEFSEDFRVLDSSLVPRFQQFNEGALHAQNTYRLQRLLIIVGGAVASVLGAFEVRGGSTWATLCQIVVGGLLSILALWLRDAKAQSRYLSGRLKAERLRSEYFLFLGRAGEYADGRDRELALLGRVATISAGSART